MELDMTAVEKAHQLYNEQSPGERDDAAVLQYLIANWKFDPKRPCFVR